MKRVIPAGHSSLHDPHDRMAGRMDDHSAQHTVLIGYTGAKYLRLSDLYPFSPREREQLCAFSPTNSHTFGRREGSLRLIPSLIPRLEPRVSSPRSAHGGDSVPGSTVGGQCAQVYLGRYGRGAYTTLGIPPSRAGRHIPPWVYLSLGYIHTYTTLGKPLPRVYTLPYHPGYTSP